MLKYSEVIRPPVQRSTAQASGLIGTLFVDTSFGKRFITEHDREKFPNSNRSNRNILIYVLRVRATRVLTAIAETAGDIRVPAITETGHFG